MGKRSAVVELFLGDMGSMQRELRPSIQREDQPTMETKLEQIAVKAVNQLPKSVVREIRTPRSVGAGGGQLPPATRWARGNSRPYRESHRCAGQTDAIDPSRKWSVACFRHTAGGEKTTSGSATSAVIRRHAGRVATGDPGTARACPRDRRLRGVGALQQLHPARSARLRAAGWRHWPTARTGA